MQDQVRRIVGRIQKSCALSIYPLRFLILDFHHDLYFNLEHGGLSLEEGLDLKGYTVRYFPQRNFNLEL